ncbi:transglutaminase-like domain-containing protein [Undibacterium flavidum]|uniref:Transglutaminase-like domain-containing protein n=1 Tax=Undibacterium flavidum TaxID=2762297 RepID=A0ABR6YAR3_9BURK|nr:transglutaminase-like domain-containing protein [Undibacterium flavidum]MBC3873738.1 hypothetical protein [Undibacterium flavidum]
MLRHQKFQKIVSSVVIMSFSCMLSYPMTAAARAHDIAEKAGLLNQEKDEGVLGNAQRYLAKIGGEKQTSRTIALTSEERMSQLLSEIHETLKATNPEAARPLSASTPSLNKAQLARSTMPALSDNAINQHVNGLRSKRTQINALAGDIAQSFKDTEQHLKNAKLPKEILARHTAAVALYQSRQAQFNQLMDKLEQADNPAQNKNKSSERQTALTNLSNFMAQHQNAKPHQYTDPNKLPFGSPSNKVRKPHDTKEQFQAGLFQAKKDKGMPTSAIPNSLTLAQAAPPALPAAQDTAETEDIQLTPAVKAQALALNNNPVQIYNWVRNNIAFIPSYGSIQGSELTLQNKRGNAFDTASLLIALYRAAGIPARYVYGTIEVPADKLMNWVGGVTKIDAAQSLLGQGGIPNVGVITGGKINTIRMEHVWVEAYVDYTPSRGAMNRTPNTWIPMDASYKQYTFTQGMDIKGKVPLNSQDLLTQIQQGATVNEAGGYVQNLNQSNLQTQLAAYQTQVKTYIDSQKANATVGDVLGTQTIKTENHRTLMGSLPYRIVTTANSFQILPENLRWKFKTNLYAADGISTGDEAMIELKQSTAKLAGKKITLSFIPATKADQDLINSYLPKAHADGSPIQPSELPTSLPGYLLNMKAEFRVDGQVIATTAGSFTMGSTLKQQNQYFNPGTGTWEGGDDNDITVGEYNAIGLDLQGMGTQQLKDLQDRMAATKAKLEQFQLNPSDPTRINGLTKEDLTGDIVQSGILSYFTQVDTSDVLIARQSGNIVSYRLPSYGRFLLSADTQYWFGVARNVSFSSVEMDVDYLMMHNEVKNADQSVRVSYIRQAGTAASAAEHQVPELIFKDPNLPASNPAQPQAVSAVKALAQAASQGQKIYTLNLKNQTLHDGIVQSLQIDSQVKSEIANALATGKEVVVHEKDVTVGGWVGSGYTILDPDSGAGAYKIAGGGNGGKLTATILGILQGVLTGLALTALIASITGGLALGAMGFILIAVHLMILNLISALIISYLVDKDAYGCYVGSFSLGLGIGLSGAAITTLMSAIIAFFGWLVIDAPPGLSCLKD